jgi:hypothetical protein
MTDLLLSSNALTGPVPTTIGRCRALHNLYAFSNRLTGTLPSTLGQCTALFVLVLFNNSIVGPIPASFGDLTQLQLLHLFNNSLSGSLPSSLGGLFSLRSLYLAHNRINGSLPISLGHCTQLQELFLHNNRLSGTLPETLGNCCGLAHFVASSNSLSGTIPAALMSLPYLTLLALSQNRLHGAVNLSKASRLGAFYAFQNQFSGALTLPASGSLKILLVHLNRLSCAIAGNTSGLGGSAVNLAAPGNKLHAVSSTDLFAPREGPSWESANSVSFLWIGSPWQTWRWVVMLCAIGAAGLFVTVATTGNVHAPVHLQSESVGAHLIDPASPAGQIAARDGGTRWHKVVGTRLWRLVHFRPAHSIGLAQLWCVRSLVLLAFPTCSVMFPLLAFGVGSLATCRDTLRLITSSNAFDAFDSPAVEWGIAAAACTFYSAAAVVVIRFQRMLRALYVCPKFSRQVGSPLSPSCAKVAYMYLRWAGLIALSSVFLVAYAFSISLPSETTFGHVPQPVQVFISEGMSLLLAITTQWIIPNRCRKLSHSVFGADGSPATTSRLIQLARLWMAILAPLLALVLVHEDCLGGWKLLWSHCGTESDFSHDINENGLQIVFLTRESVCGLRYIAGRCSRTVTQELAYLLLSKLMYGAFLLPTLMLLQHVPFCRRVKVAVVRCWNPTYLAAMEVDAEFASLLMYMEYALVFGLAVPAILPILVIVVGIQCAVMQYSSEHLIVHIIHDHQPSLQYLWFSIALGCALVAWLFIDNDLHGTWLAAFGPAGCALALYLINLLTSSVLVRD